MLREPAVAGRFYPADPVELEHEVRRFLERIEKGCGQMAVDYVPLSTRHDFDIALATYLARRRSLGK